MKKQHPCLSSLNANTRYMRYKNGNLWIKINWGTNESIITVGIYYHMLSQCKDVPDAFWEQFAFLSKKHYAVIMARFMLVTFGLSAQDCTSIVFPGNSWFDLLTTFFKRK